MPNVFGYCGCVQDTVPYRFIGLHKYPHPGFWECTKCGLTYSKMSKIPGKIGVEVGSAIRNAKVKEVEVVETGHVIWAKPIEQGYEFSNEEGHTLESHWFRIKDLEAIIKFMREKGIA